MNNPEKMLYQVNKSGSNLIILFILLNVFYTIVSLKYMPMTILIGSFTIVNIAISLMGFLGSTKCKLYNINWAYAFVVGAIAQAVRFFEIPATFDPSLRLLLIVTLELSAISLLAGALITINKCKIKTKFELAQTSKVN